MNVFSSMMNQRIFTCDVIYMEIKYGEVEVIDIITSGCLVTVKKNVL